MKLRDFVAELGDETCRRIHEEYSELEAKGKIGDGALRSVTEDYVRRFASGGSDTLVLWMDQVAKEVWRRYAIAAWNQRTPPKVKALEWDNQFEATCAAESTLGTYRLTHHCYAGTRGEMYVGWECYLNDEQIVLEGSFNGLLDCEKQKAQAAANADFARRVHACLEGYDD